MTSNGVNEKHLAKLQSDKRAGEENLESTEAKFTLVKYANKTSIMAVAAQLGYLLRISIGAENNIMDL